MKHESHYWNEPFYHLYLLLHIVTTILHTHTLPPTMDKFLKAVTKECHTLCFHPVLTLSTSSFESYRCAHRSSFINGKQWRSHGTKSALCGGCGKMVRSNFSLANMVVCKVCGLVLSCCSKFFLCFWTLHNCCFKVFECCSVPLWLMVVPSSRQSVWINQLHPKNYSLDFSFPSLGFEFFFLQVNLCNGLTLGFMFIMMHPHFVSCHNILKKFLIFILIVWQKLLANFSSWSFHLYHQHVRNPSYTHPLILKDINNMICTFLQNAKLDSSFSLSDTFIVLHQFIHLFFL